jgi:hypothetical protein
MGYGIIYTLHWRYGLVCLNACSGTCSMGVGRWLVCLCAASFWHTPMVFYMTLQSSPSTSLAGPPSGSAPSSTCIPVFVFPAAREAINRADSSASMERCWVHVSKGFNRSRTLAMEADKRTLVERHVADDGALLLVCREHAGVPQTSKQQLEKMTVGKLRRLVVRTC